MKNYWILTRVMLKNMLASMNPANGVYADGKKKNRAAVRAVMLALLSLFAVGSVVYLEYLLFKGLSAIRMPTLLPGMAIFISMVFTLVLGLFQCLSELFQGKDAPFLAVLPLTSRQVFAARMTTLYLGELALDAMLCIPAFVLYSVGRGSALPAALTGLPVLLLLPIMMNSQNMEPGDIVAMLTSENGLISRMLGAFPPARWATQALTGEAALLALFAAVSLACAAAVICLAGPGYLNQALQSTERTVHRGKRSGSFGWRTGSAFGALHSLEWKEILRTPAWAYNSLMGVIMFPLMIGIGVFSGFSKAGEGLEAMRMTLSGVDQGYVALVTAAILLFGAMVNPAVSTAISREGGRWPFALTLPVRQRTRFMAKLMVGMEINLVCMAMIAAVAWFLVRMPLQWLLIAFLLAAMIGFASAAISLWVDAVRPQLSWMTEMEAIKKNFNQVIGMMLWAVLTALCVVPAVLLWDSGAKAALAGAAGMGAAEVLAALILLNRATEKNTVLPE